MSRIIAKSRERLVDPPAIDGGGEQSIDDSNQIEPLASFAAIYTSRDGSRLTRAASFVVERYELCEDLAQSLTEQSATLLFKSGEAKAKHVAASAKLSPDRISRSVT